MVYIGILVGIIESMVNMSHKGSRNERQLAVLFGPWWCEDKGAFWRNDGSGARASIVKDIGLHPGDIKPISAEASSFPCCIEAKHWEDWDWLDFISSKKDPIKNAVIEFWFEALIECQGRYVPWNVLRKNRKEFTLVMDRGFYEGLRDKFFLRSEAFSIPKLAAQIEVADGFIVDLVAFNLKTFMETVNPNDVVAVAHSSEYREYLNNLLESADPILTKYVEDKKTKQKIYRQNKKKRVIEHEQARKLQPVIPIPGSNIC